jgi:hypothetical protein
LYGICPPANEAGQNVSSVSSFMWLIQAKMFRDWCKLVKYEAVLSADERIDFISSDAAKKFTRLRGN